MTVKTLNGHVMELDTRDYHDEIDYFYVWCQTCDPNGTQLIFQRDICTSVDFQNAVHDGVVQAKLHAVVDLTSN